MEQFNAGDEDAVTTRIDERLEGKETRPDQTRPDQTSPSQLTRSQSGPSRKDAATKTTKKRRPINPEEFTLIFHTRLRHGKISYDKGDVKYRMREGWTVPKEIENDLSDKWRSTTDAALLIYRENNTGDLRTRVNKDTDTQLSRMSDTVRGTLETVSSYFFSRPQIPFFEGNSTFLPEDDLDVE